MRIAGRSVCGVSEASRFAYPKPAEREVRLPRMVVIMLILALRPARIDTENEHDNEDD
jgi:hypothetical protein